MSSSNSSAQLLGIIVDFFKANPTLVITNLIFLLLIPVQDVVLPHFYGKIMEAIRTNKGMFKQFTYVTILLVTLQVLFLISDYHDSKLLPYLQSFIREKIVGRILENYETNHVELELGDVITKIVKVPIIVTIWFERIKNYIIPYCLVFILASIYFLIHDIYLGLGLIFVVILFISVLILSPIKCSKVSFERDTCFNVIHENIDDMFRNLFSIYGANQKDNELKRLHQYTSRYNKLYEDTVNCVLSLKVWITPIIILYMSFFLYRTYSLINKHDMNPSVFVPLFIILLYILNSMVVINDQLRDIIIEWGIIEASSDIIEKKMTKTTTSNHAIQSRGIGLRNVSFKYDGIDTPTLKNINLHINDGEKVCIIGDIGSGKSTLIKLLMKYNIPSEGLMYMNGRNYNDIPLHELRKTIGYVPQQPILFNRSILENILYGNNGFTQQDIKTILEKYNIHDFDKFEKGLDTVIGKNGSKLSGGQRQLVWCLRVLLSKPHILILDEPTSSIDEKTKNILRNMLNDIMNNKTVIMITHDPYLMKLADRVVTMNNGFIIDDIYINHH